MTNIVSAVQTPLATLEESDPNDRPASPHDAPFWLAAVADVSSDAIIGKDMSSRVMSWNKAAEAMFGYAAAEIVGGSIVKIIPTDKMDESTSTISGICNGEETIKLVTRRLNKSSKTFPVQSPLHRSATPRT
jgi:PAS domain S-box-containing protein